MFRTSLPFWVLFCLDFLGLQIQWSEEEKKGKVRKVDYDIFAIHLVYNNKTIPYFYLCMYLCPRSAISLAKIKEFKCADIIQPKITTCLFAASWNIALGIQNEPDGDSASWDLKTCILEVKACILEQGHGLSYEKCEMQLQDLWSKVRKGHQLLKHWKICTG